MVWHFIGVYRTLHGRLKIQNFPSRVDKYFFLFCICKRPCNVLYFFYLFMQDSFEGATYFKLFMCT